MGDTTPSDQPPPPEARLLHLEEVEAHNARQLELLHEALLDLGQRLDTLGGRLESLEARIHRVTIAEASGHADGGDDDPNTRGGSPDYV